MENVDVHSHFLPSEAISTLGGSVISANTGLFDIKVLNKNIPAMPKGFFDIAARKEEIKRLNIDKQVLSPTHHLFLYNEDIKVASKAARAQNEGIARVVKESNGQFKGNASLPLQDPQAALNELEYAYSTLELDGVEIGTNVAGKNLDSESLFPVYERLQDLNMPIFVHPNDIMAKERFNKYYAEIVIGTIVETSTTLTAMLLGNVFKRFNRLKAIFCHGGGAIPYQISRLEHAVKVRKEIDPSVDIRASLRNVYFDTVLFNDDSLEFLIKSMGVEHVVLGTDYPFNMGDWDSANRVLNLKPITQDQKKKILYDNPASLYSF